MKLETLTEILEKQAGARKEGTSWLLASEVEVTLFIALEGETLQVTRVSRLDVPEKLLHDPGVFIIADSNRGERFAVALEDIRAVKIDRTNDAKGRDRSAGFGK